MDKNRTQELRQIRTVRHSNVISMRMDAAYFFERGVRFMQRNDLKNALKAFQKTVEFEPENPINHCNLAGVLSELGEFEQSNEVLLHVLADLDPTMSECQFYLANNYANMGQYDIAEEYVLSYLDAEPDGEYAEEATEMLDVLIDEFGGGKAYAQWEAKRQQQERQLAERDGRNLLEEGQFEAAVEWLEQIVASDSANTAAQNNLSLAYYYTGQHGMALTMTRQVLEQQPDNIHALCNFVVFTKQLGPKDEHKSAVDALVKVFPLHYDQAMKVGTTLGLVGEHRAALSVFYRLARIVERPEPILIHSLSAAAANSGQYGLARRGWKLLSQMPDMKEVAQYYLNHVAHAVAKGQRTMRVSYQYDLPLQVQFAEMKKRLGQGSLETWRQDPLLRASLYWGLRHGNADTQKAVIRTLALIADGDAEKAVRSFLKRGDLDVTLQSAALFALQRGGARGRVDVWRNGQLESIRMSDVPKDVIMHVEPIWTEIWVRAERWLKANQKTKYTSELKRVWVSFLKHIFIRADIKMLKPDVWVAGLIYSALKRHNEPAVQKDIAEMFQVSVPSIRKAALRLDSFFLKMPEF
ncbi:hypothetical protein LLE49_03735 [Alicyclobacillus tolerans]|uniref:tetratricopeptide repeat protein n=1 Tax=Alicyclobacillus tolerans TaxID=90970 RepID=UPI001F1B9727|nr:tetratricopeptide repeat protein [Alicyclobacillus tolerans]MCF8563851.1 hypothetical protein [Alicyclobacillus tolerans]